MAPRTTQWLQERPWDNPTKGLAWGERVCHIVKHGHGEPRGDLREGQILFMGDEIVGGREVIYIYIYIYIYVYLYMYKQVSKHPKGSQPTTTPAGVPRS